METDEIHNEEGDESPLREDDDSIVPIIHGTNAQNLVEKILRNKIMSCTYWKEHCFGLTADTLLDKAMELQFVGGTFGGNRKPTDFICLLYKLLQITPERDIIVQYITNEHYKYVTALGAIYFRLTASPVDIYQLLEPYYNDRRKLRRRKTDGSFDITHVDEFIEELLGTDFSCDMVLPFLPKRHTLEETEQIEPRKSKLDDVVDQVEAVEEEEKNNQEENSTFKLKLKGSNKRKRNVEVEQNEPEPSRKESRGNDEGLSIEETNKIRIELGLKPLK
ncbi:pre-mRNA-splicing factor 38A [Acrasis kona]|uniref:Pre-mRNA-splicing factor 38 n=1 Tax=Acrasis kona TaxID=1008807 RepID=A0AAW2YT71_9EUKA